MLPKSETIQEIMRLNKSAKFEFLAAFATEDLGNYLIRLRDAIAVGRIACAEPIHANRFSVREANLSVG